MQLELWLRGVLDDGNDHSSNKFSVLKALTCPEGQIARALGHVVNLTLVPSCMERSRLRRRQRAGGALLTTVSSEHNNGYVNNLVHELHL